MRKIYFSALLGAIFTLFTSLNASAQINDMSDLFGKYELSCKVGGSDIQPTEFAITASDNVNYKKGMLKGFMGSTSTLYISKFDASAHTFTVNNATYEDAQGGKMYYGSEDGSQHSMNRYSLVFTFDPDTKTITLPNVSLGTLDNKYENFTPQVVYTDIEMIFTGEEEKQEADWSGTFQVAASKNDYNYGGKYEYPAEFTFTIIKDGDNYYLTDFLSKNIEAFTNGGILLQTDGMTAKIPENSIVGQLDESTYLTVAGGYGGDVVFEMLPNGNIKNKSYGFMISEGGTQAYYYGNENYTTPKPAYDYSGTYNATAVLAMDMSEGAAPTTGVIEIQEQDGQYIVTKFFDMTPFTMDYDLMYFTPDATDPKKGTINCTMLKTISTFGGEFKYWGLADGNLQSTPVTVTFDADGNLHIGEFCIASYVFSGSTMAPVGTPGLVAWYSSLTGTKGEASAIAATEEEATDVAAEYYTIGGVKLSAPQQGINIIRKAGKTSKIYVK